MILGLIFLIIPKPHNPKSKRILFFKQNSQQKHKKQENVQKTKHLVDNQNDWVLMVQIMISFIQKDRENFEILQIIAWEKDVIHSAKRIFRHYSNYKQKSRSLHHKENIEIQRIKMVQKKKHVQSFAN